MALDSDILWFFGLGLWSAVVVLAIKPLYDVFVRRGCDHMVAVYYNRKVAHMLAGGVPIVLSPLVFSTPFWTLIGGVVGAAVLTTTHITDRRLWWMQTEQNMNDATFALMLGISVYALWTYSGEPWLSILPACYMAFGDGVTGIIRNKMFAKRTKSAWGNLGMACVCLPLGWFVGATLSPAMAWWGLASGAVASFVERYEFGPIDDNVLIVVASSVVLLMGLA
ncbi:MAG: hypothetical protein CMA63_01410 [Euryarchaeota archaeon]|nr:hypothetical protein [Euryarchaeota archaeon]|tara:strand:+ start:3864 stop:4532 length:669 start_codon:yes stop_codon:yes gene_type:complete